MVSDRNDARTAAAAGAATATRYGWPAIVLHWLLAVAIAATWLVGDWMVGLKISPTKLKVYSWHKWAGITILVLVAVRLAVRLVRRPPPPEPMPAWQVRVASATHVLLYALMFAVPLSGWLFSSAAGFPVVWFGVVPLPDLVPRDAELKALFQSVHAVLTWILAALVVLHAAGALKHHLVDRDRTLVRMLPGLRPRTRP